MDTLSVTQLLPGGKEGAIVFKQPIQKDQPAPNIKILEWLSESKSEKVDVISTTKAAEGKDQPEVVPGFTPEDSILIRFNVPDSGIKPWRWGDFYIFSCEGGDSKDGRAKLTPWGHVHVRVSSYWSTLAIGCGALALGYVLMVLAFSATRSPRKNDDPRNLLLKKYDFAKYPSFKAQRDFGLKNYFDPVILTADAFNRGNTQKLQTLLFSFLVAGMLLVLVLRMGLLSDFSETVLALLGISAVGAAVAQATATNKNRLDFGNWAWLVHKKVLPIDTEEELRPRWSDLVMTGREFDVYKVQTVIFSVVVAVALLAKGETQLSQFAVPANLLAILGLSQIVYLGGVLVQPPSFKELDEALTKLRDKEGAWVRAKANATDTDEQDAVIGKEKYEGEPAQVAKHARESYNSQATRVAVMIESLLGRSVNRESLEPDAPGLK